ncbi:TWO-COMPONENT RESPONSE REGULATOR [Salix viminalis]|uniref:TWO-COMPONENT RESPONSE REGULATOR n=1 Tax=Salix viminalis TaxID=40686 RepID=A0A9Q0QB49_SALVM|nr:TWO-COMPONENT RESPONSE REGULATOR [Salix viminalis]
MADKGNNQIVRESKILFSELGYFTAKAQEKRDRFSEEIIAAMSLKIEIEALVTARNNLDQVARAKIEKARQWLNQKTDEFKTEEDSHENKGLNITMPISSNSKLNFFQGGTEQLMNTALGISEDTLPGSWNPMPEEIERVKASVREGLEKARERSFVFKEALSDMAKFFPKSISKKKEDNRNVFGHSGKQALPSKKREAGDAEESTKTCIHSSMADEDYTPIDPQIQNLVKKVDECIAKFDQKRQVLQDAIESDIEAVKKDQRETRELRLTLAHESGDTSSNIEAASRKIASVKQWLDQKALISGDTDTTGDQDQGDIYSVLIVHDDRNARDTIWNYAMAVGTEKQFTMEFQEAKNGKEAVYLHLAGASFDLIVMDDQMPIMTGIQATRLLRKMGVKESDYRFNFGVWPASFHRRWRRRMP